MQPLEAETGGRLAIGCTLVGIHVVWLLLYIVGMEGLRCGKAYQTQQRSEAQRGGGIE